MTSRPFLGEEWSGQACGSRRGGEEAMLPDHIFVEGISSSIAAHILDFCGDDGGGGRGAELFAAVNAASSEDVSSSSAATTTPPPPCGYTDDVLSAAAATVLSPLPSFDSTLSALLEQEQPPDADAELLLPAGYAFPATTPCAAAGEEPQTEQFGQVAVALPEAIGEPVLPVQMSGTAHAALMPLASGYDDECFAAAAAAAAMAGGYMGLDGALYQQQPGDAAQGGFFADGSGGGNGMVMMGMEEISELQRMMEGSRGLVGAHGAADPTQTVFTSTAEMQVGRSSHQLMSGCSGSPTRLLAAEMSGLEDNTFKVGRLSVEERREKIHRYIKKRNERNFSKKIKYACRKTLADSRPRVRGRFAKNDEFCEAARSSSLQNHEQYEHIGGANGEDMLDSSDILAHISGMNSFKYYTVESWI